MFQATSPGATEEETAAKKTIFGMSADDVASRVLQGVPARGPGGTSMQRLKAILDADGAARG